MKRHILQKLWKTNFQDKQMRMKTSRSNQKIKKENQDIIIKEENKQNGSHFKLNILQNENSRNGKILNQL